MREVLFKTNLDLARPFVYKLTDAWNTNYNPSGYRAGKLDYPRMGERISFPFKKVDGHGIESEYSFELEVVGITHDARGNRVEVELHMCSYAKQSIRDWEEHFNSHVRGR